MQLVNFGFRELIASTAIGIMALTLPGVGAASAQDLGSDAGLVESARIAPPRTWPELKEEVQARADRSVHPVTGMNSADVKTVLDRIDSLDRDEWGRAWAAMARDWISKGNALESSDRKAAGEAYLMAWRYAAFGAWPVATSPEKAASYKLSLEAFGKYRSMQELPIERIEIPFEGKQIAFYLQLPKAAQPLPAVIAISGLDSAKENMIERYSEAYIQNGFAFVAIDSPNCGENKVAADLQGERVYQAVLEYLLKRPEIDPKRIGVQGASQGGYWATKLAFAEPERLNFAINWGGPLDKSWDAEVIQKTLSTREYLFDLPQALMTVWGYNSIDDLVVNQHRLSIVEQGLLEKPTPNMLIVNGLKDSLVPAEDTLLMLQHGMPKSAWIHPAGVHVGRAKDWPDRRILTDVIVPWVVDTTQKTN